MYRISASLLVALVIISKTTTQDLTSEYAYGPPLKGDIQKLTPSKTDEEYIRHIHSMINAYRSDMVGGRLVIETNSLINTKYRTWKRNADLINSLLSLPKGLNDAGR